MIHTLAALGGMLLGLAVGAVAMREWIAASRVITAACDDDGYGDVAEMVGHPDDCHHCRVRSEEWGDRVEEFFHAVVGRPQSYDEQYSAEAAATLDIPLHDYYPARPGNARYPRRTT